jgi:hypothetical protein
MALSEKWMLSDVGVQETPLFDVIMT